MKALSNDKSVTKYEGNYEEYLDIANKVPFNELLRPALELLSAPFGD